MSEKGFWQCCLVSALLLFAASCLSPATSSPAKPALTQVPVVAEFKLNARESEESIVKRVNRIRAKRGLKMLTVEPVLVDIARQRSEDMMMREFFSHYDPTTKEVLVLGLLERRGYTDPWVGENIGLVKPESPVAFSKIAQRLMEAWMGSPSHRKNILNASFRETGVGVVVAENGKQIFVTQIFLGGSNE